MVSEDIALLASWHSESCGCVYPSVAVVCPMTDLRRRCWFFCSIQSRAATLSHEEEQEPEDELLTHLSLVSAKRENFRQVVVNCKDKTNLQELQKTASISSDIAMHYSFNFTQQARNLIVCGEKFSIKLDLSSSWCLSFQPCLAEIASVNEKERIVCNVCKHDYLP